MHSTRFAVLLTAGAALLTSACSTAAAPTPPPAELPMKAFAQLTLSRVQQARNSEGLVLSVTVENPYREDIEGVRVVYRILLNRDERSREIARTQDQFPAMIEPGSNATVVIQLPEEANQIGTFGTFIHAFGATRGGRPVDLPPVWDADAK